MHLCSRALLKLDQTACETSAEVSTRAPELLQRAYLERRQREVTVDLPRSLTTTVETSEGQRTVATRAGAPRSPCEQASVNLEREQGYMVGEMNPEKTL